MAIIFGKDRATDFDPANLMSFGKSFSRMGAQPLDMNEVWYDLDALTTYAKTNATAYVGMKVVYVDEEHSKVYHYSIELDGSLKEIGSTILGDNKTISVASDGTVSLSGISGILFERDILDSEGNATGSKEEVTYQPLLTKNGLIWIEPSKTTVEGLATLIDSLTSRVSEVEESLGHRGDDDSDPTGVFAEISTIKTDLIGTDSDTSEDDTIKGSKKYADSLAKNYDVAGAADSIKDELLGTSESGKDSLTIYGVKAYTDSVTATAVETAKNEIIGTDNDTANANTIKGAKKYADVSILESTPEGFAKRFTFTQNGNTIGVIDLAKELVVTSGTVENVIEDNSPYAGAAIGDKYIKLIIANQEDPIYVPAKDLVDVYTAQKDSAEIQITINDVNEISATIVNGSISQDKLSDSVKEKLNKEWEEVGVAQTLVSALAEGKVTENADAIEAINAPETGILDQAKKHANDLNETTLLKITDLQKESHTHENKSLLDSITDEKISNWDSASLKAHDHSNKSVLDGITSDKVSSWDTAERNIIASVDPTQFAIDTDRNLILLDIAQSKIKGIINQAGNEITLSEALENKVDKVEGSRLISSEEIQKLAGLVYDPETGETSLPISGQITMSQVDGLSSALNEKVDKVEGMGLSANNFTDSLLQKLNGIEENANVNLIESITINGVKQDISDKSINIPLASSSVLGVVLGSSSENKISVLEDGTMEVNSLNVNKLVQTASEFLILNGGSANS